MKVDFNDRELQAWIRNKPGRLSAFMREEAQDIVADIKLSFGTSPSSPGEPPGVDTGALRASIMTYSETAYRQIIQDGVEYGVFHELAIGHPARPFVVPVFEERIKDFAARLRRALG